MKTETKTTRELAIEWFDSLSDKEQYAKCNKWGIDYMPKPTNREIEIIYLVEHNMYRELKEMELNEKSEWNKQIQETVDLEDWANDGSEPTTLPIETVEEAFKQYWNVYLKRDAFSIDDFNIFKKQYNWQKQQDESLRQSHKKLVEVLEKILSFYTGTPNPSVKLTLESQEILTNAKQIQP